jgi:hypothetical protein
MRFSFPLPHSHFRIHLSSVFRHLSFFFWFPVAA